MRSKSKIFLIVSGVFAAIGAVLMILGAIFSSVNNEKLFAETLENGKGYVYTYESITGKLKIDCYDATINIIGNSEESKIELINFNENLYTFGQTSAMITFKESSDVGSTFQFWDGNFSFKGLRFLAKGGSNSQNKIINVYLTEEDEITDIIIDSTNGTIIVSDLSSNTNYTFTTENTPVKLTNISTKQVISVNDNIGKSNVTMDSVSAKEVNLDILKAEISGTISCDILSIKDNMGSAKIQHTPLLMTDTIANINVNSKLIVNDIQYDNSYSNMNSDIELTDEDGNDLHATINIEGSDLSVELNAHSLIEQSDKETSN